jgi:tRNA uridine 5-carbamoylmethylation protein Kti12
MRREVYQLAAEAGAGFGIAHVHADLETALERNRGEAIHGLDR